nr:MAG TPA: hypothetical protein [Caudoviricetes sp.]
MSQVRGKFVCILCHPVFIPTEIKQGGKVFIRRVFTHNRQIQVFVKTADPPPFIGCYVLIEYRFHNLFLIVRQLFLQR